jgi:hypothetical protein
VTDTNVIKLAQPGTFTDSLTEILPTSSITPSKRAGSEAPVARESPKDFVKC